VNPFLHQLGINLKLHARNKMALIYSYLFPTMFLVAFWVLYRFEQVPLVRHMGELLTVTALGGACFGLPTTMVSERERGVWRRYRLAPVPTGTLVSGTVAARYVLLILAGLLQLALAIGIGMPLPQHPFALFVAFSGVAFAFIGLGLVIAMMADNVPAVQALGQCIFLPMLIIGGVAVPLASLPDWAQRLSTFFPGRYAVDAIQACVTGGGLDPARFSLVALLIIGMAGCVAGAKMFRWDAQQRFATAPGKAWVAVALAAWAAVGLAAEMRRGPGSKPQASVNPPAPPVTRPAEVPQEPSPPPTSSPSPEVPAPAAPSPPKTATRAPVVDRAPTSGPAVTPPSAAAPAPAPAPATAPGSPSVAAGSPVSWRAVTIDDIERDLIFTRLPPDSGIVTPIARPDDVPDETVVGQLDVMRSALPGWKPGKVEDPVQRVRNFLYVAAVTDVFQMEGFEQFVPLVVYERIQEDIPKDDLIRILYWIATHPFEGDDSAVDELRPLGLNNGPNDMETTRDRVGVYAVKLLGRLTGKIVVK
jgi:ABC-2 type transport system permease protein